MLYAKLLLLGSELLLARCKPLKMQDLGILLLTQQFFGISTLISPEWQLQSLLAIPFSERTQYDLSGVLNILPKL